MSMWGIVFGVAADDSANQPERQREMKKSTDCRTRKYVAGGILSIAALFGGALGSAGISSADQGDVSAPVAPVAPAHMPPPPMAPVAPAPNAPVLDPPARTAPGVGAPVRNAPGVGAPAHKSGNGKGHGQSSRGRSH